MISQYRTPALGGDQQFSVTRNQGVSSAYHARWLIFKFWWLVVSSLVPAYEFAKTRSISHLAASSLVCAASMPVCDSVAFRIRPDHLFTTGIRGPDGIRTRNLPIDSRML